jgi:5-oxoprolinase (ATP-hydrolysing)
VSPAPWQLWIDTGGTFTDCLAHDPDGGQHRLKVLSSGAVRCRAAALDDASNRLQLRAISWSAAPGALVGFAITHPGGAALDDGGALEVATSGADGAITLSRPLRRALSPDDVLELTTGEPAPLLAARLVTGTPAHAALPDAELKLATTLGTNALLQRCGAEVAFFVTAGFGDLLRIGTQQRPDLFALQIQRPAPLYAEALEVPERIAADGAVLRPLDEQAVRAAARAAVARGLRVAAVALVNSYVNASHEERLRELLLEAGFEHVSCSQALSPLITLLSRAETAVVDAYLTPLLRGFLQRVEQATGQGSSLSVLTSAGGLVRAGSFCPKDSLLSGPAGGVVGAAREGRLAGFDQLIAFDMGGTSTDVARYGGDFDYRFELTVGDAHLSTPAMAIETVAAGGGSICGCRDGALVVGPQSAGADPGPACYGAGGPLTLTDVNLLLGRLEPARFGIPVDAAASRAALATVQAEVADQGAVISDEALLEGFLELADERMADAIRKVSLRRGYDPADHALVAFGGAGPMHACGVAERLGMRTVVVPADAGLLSAVGLGYAPVEAICQRQVLRPLQAVAAQLPGWLDALSAQARCAVERDGVAPKQVEIRRRIAALRLVGQDTALQVEVAGAGGIGALQQAFACSFVEHYGHQPADRPVELESLKVIASSRRASATPVPARQTVELGAERIAVVPGPHSTVIKAQGWELCSTEHGALLLRRPAVSAHSACSAARRQQHEAVQLELFVGRLEAAAEQMGELLARTALSTNIKERRDFSCALLDAAGELVVNAPHIPVHLGSLGLCVRSLTARRALAPGETVVTNHPRFGGSHLPDVTVVTPAHTPEGELLGYVASRAHHAEIGGASPGSMPPRARCLAEEGVVIPPLTLIDASGAARWDELRRLLEAGPYPSRAVEDNLADLRAAVSANRLGQRALETLSAELGLAGMRRQLEALKGRAERQVRRSLAALPDGAHAARAALDDGTPLCVTVTVRGDQADIDFAGTGGVHPGNLNATPAIVRSAVIYVLRLLVDRALPLNEGLMRAVTLTIPPGLLAPPLDGDDPAWLPAVAGGNVETSQQLVDLLLAALGLLAGSQGTMNNVVFGNARFGYYETVGGGSGAGPGFDGASAVHSHMTNTRITDVEVLEQRFPVRVERFGVRRGSGGAGLHRGGDGAVRELTFLEPMTLSLLTQRRGEGPAGLAGGDPGLPGAQRLVRADGGEERLEAIDGREVTAGDRLVLETPGGGGHGAPRFCSS